MKFTKDEPVRYFTREREIPVDENWNNYQQAILEPAVAESTERIQAISNMLDMTIQVFGEIFGKGVQKGVDYGFPEGQKVFRAFDMMLDGVWIFQEGFFSYPPLENIRVPVLDIVDSLQEALDYNVNQLTTFNPVEGNIWEGVVIKPYQRVYTTPDGSVFSLKKKHPTQTSSKRGRRGSSSIKTVSIVERGLFMAKLPTITRFYRPDEKLEMIKSLLIDVEIDTQETICHGYREELIDWLEDSYALIGTNDPEHSVGYSDDFKAGFRAAIESLRHAGGY